MQISQQQCQPTATAANATTSSSASSTSSTSQSSSYHDPSSNDLTLLTGAILLTADCMGTGILALPADIRTLGTGLGLGFLILNLPINLYAGTILGWCALFVEEKILGHSVRKEKREKQGEELDGGDFNYDNEDDDNEKEIVGDTTTKKTKGKKEENKSRRKKGYSSVENVDSPLSTSESSPVGMVELRPSHDDVNDNNQRNKSKESVNNEWNEDDYLDPHPQQNQHQHVDTATFDFVGMTSMLFDHDPTIYQNEQDAYLDLDSSQETSSEHPNNNGHHHHAITYKHPFTKLVLAIYYTNLFLVLGNYILVMSHSVSAMAGEDNLCIPTAGIIASTLMFALSQLRTMANLGRSVSAISLMALLVVVLQCLHALQGESENVQENEDNTNAGNDDSNGEQNQNTSLYYAESTLAKMSSLASIGFAVGSQKLFLNIRHEMKDRAQAAPGSLSISLTLYGIAYVTVCLLAGPNPPSFLFDAIPNGIGRRIAGFMLWVHVAVSYAINSQAFCSSVDRVVGHRVKIGGLDERHRVRWAILTACVAVTSYLVANAIPFFKDLVALCGALTSIPLTLLLPGIFYRRIQGVPICFPTLHSKSSFVLVVFSIVFMVVGLFGAVGSITVDWKHHEGPFACH